MKKFAFILSISLFTIIGAMAQCDSTVMLHTVRQEMLNEKDEVIDNEDDAAKIDIGKDTIIITKDNGENIMTASIVKKDCKWKDRLKDGKSTYDIKIAFPDGTESAGTGVLEGKEGNLHFLLTIEKMQGRKIKAYIDKM